MTYSELLDWYWHNLRQEWTRQIRAWPANDERVTSSVRTVDSVVWLVGLARKWLHCRKHEQPFEKSKEINLFFTAYPDIANKLGGH